MNDTYCSLSSGSCVGARVWGLLVDLDLTRLCLRDRGRCMGIGVSISISVRRFSSVCVGLVEWKI